MHWAANQDKNIKCGRIDFFVTGDTHCLLCAAFYGCITNVAQQGAYCM